MFSELGGAESDALDGENALNDPRLDAIIDVWSILSESTKAGILAMISAVDGAD